MLDANTREQARVKLTVGPLVPDDTELDARYLGEFPGREELARALFQMDAPHIEITRWPYSHIDWDAAADELFARDGARNLLEVNGHWFDALAQAPVLAS